MPTGRALDRAAAGVARSARSTGAEEPRNAMLATLTTSDVAYQCLHEAGHAAASLVAGGEVEFMELLRDESNGARARARCIHNPHQRQNVACGGFAVEYMLFRGNRLIDLNGAPLAEQAFIDVAMKHAGIDKVVFFGSDCRSANGAWPADMDRAFMSHAIQSVVPILRQLFSRMERLAAELQAQGRLESEAIKLILA